MKNILIIIDTREKDPRIQNELSMRGISFKKRKLDFGDYSFEYDNISYEKKICVERKGSIDEIVGNFTKGRSRFQKEFERSKGCKVLLMVEADARDIQNKNYRSSLPPNKLRSFLNTWCYKFGLNLFFVKKEKAADFIINVFNNFLEQQN